jgi:uncharacterized protein YndB with AHSA1/START domain
MKTETEAKSISMEYELPYPPTKVWRALTEPALLAGWLMDNDMRPVIGQHFTFRSKPMPWWDGIVRCEVLEIDPHKRLSYTWQSGPESSPLDTVVIWTLTPTQAGTRLTLEHSGFTPANGAALEGARTGWQRMIAERLKEVLAKAA